MTAVTERPAPSASARDRLAQQAGWDGFETDRFSFPVEPAPRKSWARRGIEFGGLGVAILVTALVLKSFVVDSYQVPSSSMSPTVEVGDRFLVNRLALTLDPPRQGDVVVFDRPEGAEVADEQLVKRVIAEAGQSIEARNGVVYVDGEPLEEPYLAAETTTGDFDPLTVPADHVFVMGDHRRVSIDSRAFGPVPHSLLVGRAVARYWPLDRMGTLAD